MNLKSLIAMTHTRQLDLARELGVSQSAVSQWIRHGLLPRMEHLHAIAEARGCHLDIMTFLRWRRICFLPATPAAKAQWAAFKKRKTACGCFTREVSQCSAPMSPKP